MVNIYKGDNWVIRTTPSTRFVRERLSNGQYMHLWLWRQRVDDPEMRKQITYTWQVGLYIGHPKGAALWKRKAKQKTKQTGDCGLEGLRAALQWIRGFTDIMGWKEELQIMPEDTKRHNAYKYLLRYPGFMLYEGDNPKDSCIAYRRPDYWEWIPHKRERLSND